MIGWILSLLSGEESCELRGGPYDGSQFRAGRMVNTVAVPSAGCGLVLAIYRRVPRCRGCWLFVYDGQESFLGVRRKSQ